MSRAVEVNEEWTRQIVEQVQGLSYGTVQITVHEGRIVQIERTEKIRFDAGKAASGGSRRNGLGS